jgi:hypothetical protein
MAELPPLARDQRKTDAHYLRLLLVFYFAGAGSAVLRRSKVATFPVLSPLTSTRLKLG